MSTIPVHIVTGFLGSGKTTLLNAMMMNGFAGRTAVVVNEFGDVGLDQSFIQTSSEEVLVLKNGCICCVVREDLSTTLKGLASLNDRMGPLERVVIETSGISDPEPILQTIGSDYALRVRFHIGAVLCTIDAMQPALGDEAAPEGMAQMSAADILAITKTDLVEGPARVALASALAHIFPGAELIDASGVLAASALVQHEASPGHKFGRDMSAAHAGPAPRPHGIASIVIREAAPASWPAFVIWLTSLLHLHGDAILRCKGMLYDPTRALWMGVHGVRRYLHAPVHLSGMPEPACGSCLVFITRGLDPSRIAASYRRHVAKPPADARSQHIDAA